MTRQVVTVEAGGLSLGCAVALYHLLEKLGREHGVSDVLEAQFTICLSLYDFVGSAPDVEGLKQALEALDIAATVSEVVL